MDLWKLRGECGNHDAELWFPVSLKQEASAPAIAICATCPVRAECLAYAVGLGIAGGVWGGLSEAERRDLTPRPESSPWRIPDDQVEHGTEGAYRWHLRWSRPACAACIQGERDRGRAKREARRLQEAS